MKVTSLQISAEGSLNPITLSYKDPSSQNPFQAIDVQGLDADDIIKRYYGTGSSGRKFYDFSLRKRVIVFHMALNPRWSEEESYSDLRDQAHRLIGSSRSGEVKLSLFNGAVAVAEIKGTITKAENVLFSKAPATKLTMECTDPMLRGPEWVSAPVINASVATTTIVDLPSTAPHGLFFNAKITAPAATFTLNGEDWAFKSTPVGLGGFQINDRLRCASERGGRDLNILRGGVTYYIADSIHAGSVWPLIFPGSNTFTSPNTAVWEGIVYPLTYWGV